jgi:photosystem I P700 chlorophyll a apoprotein A2
LPLDNRKNKFEPLFAEYIQAASGSVYEFNVLLSDSTSPAVAGNQIWLPGWLEAINSGKMIYS